MSGRWRHPEQQRSRPALTKQFFDRRATQRESMAPTERRQPSDGRRYFRFGRSLPGQTKTKRIQGLVQRFIGGVRQARPDGFPKHLFLLGSEDDGHSWPNEVLNRFGGTAP